MIINVCLQGVTRLRELQEPPAPGVQLLQRSQLLLSALHWVNLAEKSFIRIHIHIFFLSKSQILFHLLLFRILQVTERLKISN